MALSALRRLPTLDGLAALLFASGIGALLLALYNDAGRQGPYLYVALTLLAATFVCWIAAAKWGTEPEIPPIEPEEPKRWRLEN